MSMEWKGSVLSRRKMTSATRRNPQCGVVSTTAFRETGVNTRRGSASLPRRYGFRRPEFVERPIRTTQHSFPDC
jgi:hypothetical protein